MDKANEVDQLTDTIRHSEKTRASLTPDVAWCVSAFVSNTHAVVILRSTVRSVCVDSE